GRRGAGPSSWGAAETARSARTVRRRGRCRKVLVPCIILRSLTDFSHRHSDSYRVLIPCDITTARVLTFGGSSMCGIIGFTGRHQASPRLLEGLRRLEYRGYDSAGLAILSGEEMQLRRRVGRVAALTELLQQCPAPGTQGIGHTRWATHGGVTETNTHPHLGGEGTVAVVH